MDRCIICQQLEHLVWSKVDEGVRTNEFIDPNLYRDVVRTTAGSRE